MGCYLFLTGASMMPGSGNVPFVICTPPKDVDFLKVVRLVFWSGVVGPGTNDFYPLQRAKFTGGIFLL